MFSGANRDTKLVSGNASVIEVITQQFDDPIRIRYILFPCLQCESGCLFVFVLNVNLNPNEIKPTEIVQWIPCWYCSCSLSIKVKLIHSSLKSVWPFLLFPVNNHILSLFPLISILVFCYNSCYYVQTTTFCLCIPSKVQWSPTFPTLQPLSHCTCFRSNQRRHLLHHTHHIDGILQWLSPIFHYLHAIRWRYGNRCQRFQHHGQ